MRSLRHAITRRIAAFLRETSGSYSVEAVLIFPTLVWAGLATLTYVDGYRQQTMNLRTTYAIADLLSRQWDPVGPDFVDGLGRVHDHLTGAGDDTSLRVTVVYWDEAAARHTLVWSRSTAGAPDAVTAETLGDISGFVPALADADSAIVVETWMDHEPAFAVGLDPQRFVNRVVTSPRFTPQLKFDPDL